MVDIDIWPLNELNMLPEAKPGFPRHPRVTHNDIIHKSDAKIFSENILGRYKLSSSIGVAELTTGLRLPERAVVSSRCCHGANITRASAPEVSAAEASRCRRLTE